VADETWNEEMRATLQSQGQERDRRIIEAFHEWAGRHNDPRTTRLAKGAEELVMGTTLLDELTRPAVFTDEDLARVRCPVLAMYGERSDIRHKGERLAGQLPSCQLEIIAGGSHVILWEATTHLRDRIIAWLAEQNAAASGAAPG
jgi:pimeloyl-ACP methyl ester carboxylesterase